MPEEAERLLGRITDSGMCQSRTFFQDLAHGLSIEDMVNDILQLVVDMPEDQNLIWQAYQDEEPSDDEEEARMLESNEV